MRDSSFFFVADHPGIRSSYLLYFIFEAKELFQYFLSLCLSTFIGWMCRSECREVET